MKKDRAVQGEGGVHLSLIPELGNGQERAFREGVHLEGVHLEGVDCIRFPAETIFISSPNCPNTLGKDCFFIGPNYFLLLAQIGRNYFKVV
jgi:hypothetical protein